MQVSEDYHCVSYDDTKDALCGAYKTSPYSSCGFCKGILSAHIVDLRLLTLGEEKGLALDSFKDKGFEFNPEIAGHIHRDFDTPFMTKASLLYLFKESVLQPSSVLKVVVDKSSELSTLKRLNHNNIVGLLHSYESASLHYLFLEYLRGNNLEYTLEQRGWTPLEYVFVEKIALASANALAYLHNQRIVHRDISPSNIIKEQSRVVITDFELARISEEDDPVWACTDGYAPLEAHNSSISDNRYDLYSLGCVLATLLTGEVTPCSENRNELSDPMVLVLQKIQDRVSAGEVPARMLDAITEMVEIDRDNRPRSMEEVMSKMF